MCLHKAATARVLKVMGDILRLLKLKYGNFCAPLCGGNVDPVAAWDVKSHPSTQKTAAIFVSPVTHADIFILLMRCRSELTLLT